MRYRKKELMLGEAWKGEPFPLEAFAWLADAPLFLDATEVSAFYDAVVRPEAETKSVTLRFESSEARTGSATFTGSAELGLGPLIRKLIPGLDAKVTAGATGTKEKSSTAAEGEEIVLSPIDNPHRQLVQLAAHYLSNWPERLQFVRSLEDEYWRSTEFIGALPRGLVFIDVPRHSAFIPMAAELTEGKVVTFYGAITAPTYPGYDAPEGQLKKYWQQYVASFNPTSAMEIIEKTVAAQGRISWIDYRLPVGIPGETVHIHVSPRQEYDTGTFAYNWVKRGAKHGLRLVASMRSGPAINVLAAFST